ncbi:MAG: MoxR family ATPase [Candidatus Altiarchaeota archaeon]|nr:MoxR family ATPase [Candidatus Altiarchaeota archaeon]
MKTGGSLWGEIEIIKGEEKIKERDLEMIYPKIKELYNAIVSEMGKIVIGQDEVIEQILVSIFSKNHALLEGYPGLGKTFTVSTLSQILDLDFTRIQCTPDLMPSDITGTYIVEEEGGGKRFKFEKGPVFTNILLTDEINRATPKTQSALLEAMQERQVSAGNKTHKIDSPFFVLATQNPIEMEGTYPLPEAQLDRFLLKIIVTYPKKEDESRIIELFTGEDKTDVKQLIHKNEFLNIQRLTRKVPISQENRDYVLDIVTKTRPENDGTAREYLDYGASPRASIGLVLASKARALVRGRSYVNREDIEKMAYPVLRHRIIPNFESERKGVTTDHVIEKILKEVG